MVLKVLASVLKLTHVVVIAGICAQLSTTTPVICLEAIGIQIGLTILSILVSRKHRFDLLQLAISLCLTYTLIPNNYSFFSGLFFLKIIYVFNSMGEAIEDLLSAPGNSLTQFLKILLNLFRYTLAEYLFLGLSLMGYKLWTLGDPQGAIPQDYVTLYQLVVTATTIGYGDITPKTQWQITYFTYTIPFMCASFVVYFNATIPIIGQLIDVLSGNSLSGSAEGCNKPSQALNSKIWTSEERESFINFIDQVAKRQAQHEEHHKRLGHNWIAISANHYERQIPLINEFLKGDESKEIKLKVSSKVRRQYYPAGWIILHAGDVSEDLMMIDQGQVTTSAGKKSRGFVFNKEGFFRRGSASEAVTTKTFVSVWALSLRDLQEIGKSSSQIRQIVSELSAS